MKTTKFTKVISIIIAIAIMLMSLPVLSASAADPTPSSIIFGEKVVDPSTFDSWRDLFPTDNTEWAGRIWTDKTVFADGSSLTGLEDANGNDVTIEMLDENNNFLVALSALASNKSIVGYSYTPTDTMLVLDVSGSMASSGYVDDLVTAANDAIAKLLALNKHNRIGVVLYSGNPNFGDSAGSTATVLLPLDRYTQANGRFLTNDEQTSISINERVQNSAQQGTSRYMSTSSKSVRGGTYIQNGVYMAMEEFLDETDTVIPDGEVQAGTVRTPIFVLMSDGEPTTATTNFAGQNNGNNTVGLGTSNLGDGGDPETTALATAIDFVNQLTAAYAVHRVGAHYEDTAPLFYTLGVGANNNTLDSAVLDPDSFRNTDDLWEDYIGTRNNYNLLVDIEDGRNPDQVSVLKIADIANADQKNYVTQYFPASNAAGLITAFDSIVKQIIIQSLYYPTLVEGDNHDHDGFIEFRDDIGHYMDVKDIKGIMIGDTLFTGERLARNFVPSGGELVDSNGNWTSLGDNVVWSVKERIGIADAETARDLINSAYEAGQLRYYEATGEWSNFIGWYADDDGNFMGHWHEGHTAADVPTINGVKATYINRSYGMLGAITSEHAATDLMYISTQVHTRIEDGNVSLIWRVPASLIPVVSYNITINGENLNDATAANIAYAAAEPIRILFEVGLGDEITPVNIHKIVTDPEAHIADADEDGVSDDGKYYFYTNWFNGNVNHEHFPATEDTIVFFEPSIQNERYYYNEETAVWINAGTDADPDWELYKGAKPSEDDGNTYYRQYIVFDGRDIIRQYEVMSEATIGVLEEENRNADNSWDIPAGTVHRVLEPHNLEKMQNLTGSLAYARYPVVEELPEHDGFYVGSLLGNNGMISVDSPQGIKITKVIDNTLYGTDNTYTFTLDIGTDADDNIKAYHEAADGTLTENILSMQGGIATIDLKANESYYIISSDDRTFTVSEQINGEYKVAAVEVDGIEQSGITATLTAPAEGFSEAVFENTRVVNDGTIVISKEVVYDEAITYNADQLYTFEWYNKADPNSKDTFQIKASESKLLSNLTPGETYVITEINIPDGYAPRNESIEVTIPDNQAAVVPVHFINDYTPAQIKPVNLIVSGSKNFTGREWTASDTFSFRLQMLNGAIWENVGNVRTATAANRNYVFDFAADEDLVNYAFTKVGTYRFRIIEEIPAEPLGGVTYDNTYHYFAVAVTDKEMDGKLEISEISADATASVIQNGNIWTVDADFNNVYAPTEGDELTIIIDKTVTDKVGTDKSYEGFTFGLYTENGTTPIVTSAPTDLDGRTTIDLTFPASAAGREYNFVIREIVPEDALGGMDYDDTEYPVTIKIVDNGDGTVSAVIVTEAGEVNDMTAAFENIYDPSDVGIVIIGTKIMEGRDFEEDEFTFELLADDAEEPMIAGNTASIEGIANFAFELDFDVVGTYHYTLTEAAGDAGGVTYDEKAYDIVIIVSDDADNDGALDIAVLIDGEEVAGDEIPEILVFENIYTIAEDVIRIEAEKTLNGRDLAAEEFSFSLYDGDMQPIETVRNTADGKVIFSDIELTDIGEYVFYVKEVIGNAENITYDESVYKIIVIATDNGAGEFEVEYYYEVNDQEVDGVNFKNIYTPPAPPAPPAPPEIPQTGDAANLNLWLALFFVSGGLFGATAKRKKKAN